MRLPLCNDKDFLRICLLGTVQEVESAIKNGANINDSTENGATDLIFAAANTSNPEVISVLIEKGADTQVKDKDGKRAIDHASKNKNIKDTKAYQELNDASN